jgi:hypothetical protein
MIGILEGTSSKIIFVLILAREKDFLFVTLFSLALGPMQPHIQWVLCTLSLRAMQLVCEADLLLSSSSKVKNVWRSTSTPHASSWHGA